MELNVDWLGVASWLGILTMALQYYLGNFVKPLIWEETDDLPVEERIKRRKRFKRICDWKILTLLVLAVALGVVGIVIKLL